MPLKSPKRKGDRLEREVAKQIREAGYPAQRVPLSGACDWLAGDVTATLPALGNVVLECKARQDFATLHKWLEHRDGLVLKADRKEALMVLRLADFLKVLRASP
jgi:Holliday junction resolvase